MSTKWRNFASAAIRGQLCIAEGEDGNDNTLLSTEIYDLQTRKWTDITNMITKRQEFAAAAIGGQLCVVGGEDINFKNLLSAEMYDP